MQFNREAKEGWRFAADAARITDQKASSADRRHKLSEKEKEQWHQSQAMRVELPGLGKCTGRYASFFCFLLALGRLDHEE